MISNANLAKGHLTYKGALAERLQARKEAESVRVKLCETIDFLRYSRGGVCAKPGECRVCKSSISTRTKTGLCRRCGNVRAYCVG